jgi:hypothetical protein
MRQLYLIITVLILIFGIAIYPTYKDNLCLFTVLVLSFALCVIYISLYRNNNDVIEHLQISGEAVQNVGSIYNSNQMVVGKFTATGDLATGGNLTTDGNLAVKGTVKCGDIISSQVTTNTLQLQNGWSVSTNNDGLSVQNNGKRMFGLTPDGNMKLDNGKINLPNGWQISTEQNNIHFAKDGTSMYTMDKQKLILPNGWSLWATNNNVLQFGGALPVYSMWGDGNFMSWTHTCCR